MAEKLTTLAKRLRPFIIGMAADAAAAGGIFNLNKIFHFPIGNGFPTAYTKTAANLTTALGLATNGELVEVYGPCTLTGSFTIPAGVELRASPFSVVILAGTISTSANSKLVNLKISATANSALALYGITGPTSGSAYIQGCDIYAIQSGAGNAYAVGAINGLLSGDGSLYIDDCLLYGSSVSGSGYGGRSTAGKLYVTGNTRGVYGSTDRFTLV